MEPAAQVERPSPGVLPGAGQFDGAVAGVRFAELIFLLSRRAGGRSASPRGRYRPSASASSVPATPSSYPLSPDAARRPAPRSFGPAGPRPGGRTGGRPGTLSPARRRRLPGGRARGRTDGRASRGTPQLAVEYLQRAPLGIQERREPGLAVRVSRTTRRWGRQRPAESRKSPAASPSTTSRYSSRIRRANPSPRRCDRGAGHCPVGAPRGRSARDARVCYRQGFTESPVRRLPRSAGPS